MHQIQYNQCVNKKPRSTIAMLCEVQYESSEKSIIQPREIRGDGKQMEQMVTPVDIPALTCYQTVPNNSVVEQTDEINNIDL